MADSRLFLANVPPGMEARLQRVALGLTQWEVAQRAGVAPWAVSAVETNGRYVPPAWVAKIRAALELEANHGG